MSKGYSLGNISGASGSLEINATGFSASRYSLLITGSFDGGTVAVNGGDGTTFAPVMLTTTSSGHVALTISVNVGLYTFDALCAFLQVVLSGATAADLDFTLYPEPRS